ncbi:hypothetical protein SVI_1358 [Shewanella violacea DSS12]|uniref:Uncharacterized protein n=1 Tax=Shewanella violacea (strain JCM 10179 / CIP 106290 / LMG 19151 / DSS12) TaxID=637905 RepID=D4ZI30_SHEVD|nr:hypothetical protein SVI_1358 [Shewanella violacea DSS12]
MQENQAITKTSQEKRLTLASVLNAKASWLDDVSSLTQKKITHRTPHFI